MRARARCSLTVLFLLATATAAGESDSAPTLLFNALWSVRARLSRADYRLLFVELLDPKEAPQQQGSKTLRLRSVGDLKTNDEGFSPQEIQVAVSLSASRALYPKKARRHYLALLRRYTVRDQQTWQIYPIYSYREKNAQGRYTYKSYYLLPFGTPGGPVSRAVRELILPGADTGGPDEKFGRMLQYVAGQDQQLRDLASSFAAVNGWGFDGKQQDQPDAFARAVLTVEHAIVRRRMARAYSAARADLLPRDGKLLKALFEHDDPEVTGPVLRDNLRHGSERAAELAPVIRAGLAVGENRRAARSFILLALTGWGQKALAFQNELQAIALGQDTPPASHADRLVALRVLLDAKADNAAELVRKTLIEVPSAVALEYAVAQKCYSTVPIVINAVREDKLTWTDAHSAALSLLTRRFPDGSFQQFQQWWAEMERVGRASEAVESGFVDARANARARKLIDQLGSQAYKRRQAARQQLAEMGMTVLPSLLAATKNADAEIAVSAAYLVRAAEAKFKDCKDRLAATAGKERSGKAFLPHGADSDQPQEDEAAGAEK